MMEHTSVFNSIPEFFVRGIDVVKKGGSSKGLQRKWKVDNKWLKPNEVGYESFGEVVASRVASCLNMCIPVIQYFPCRIKTVNNRYYGCYSQSYLADGMSEITAKRLLQLNDIDINAVDNKYEALVASCKQLTPFAADQLSCLFQFDRLVMNKDRHLHNINFVCGMNNILICFDNGDSCLVDVSYDFPIGLQLHECLKNTESKPFLVPFDVQCNAMKMYSSFELKAINDTVRLSDLRGFVPNEVFDRTMMFLGYQFRKYLGIQLVVC